MATLGSFGLICYLSMGGSKKEQGPALNATSKDEEKFIKYVGLFQLAHRPFGSRKTMLTVYYAVNSWRKRRRRRRRRNISGSREDCGFHCVDAYKVWIRSPGPGRVGFDGNRWLLWKAEAPSCKYRLVSRKLRLSQASHKRRLELCFPCSFCIGTNPYC